ncbi:MAG: DAK2 domain-containing protein [Gemmatimonadota bacterium]
MFPVPDGDTGTNMAATLVSAVERAQRVRDRTVGKVSRALADGALYGACGNSGAILAQFFEGFAEALDGSDRTDGEGLASAVWRANESAQAALARPREGTILSVMRAWADRFRDRASIDGADLLEVFRDSLEEAREALARTPRQLKELARAGVVDAGAQGFVYFLEGMLHFAEGRVAGSVIEEGDHAAPLQRARVAEDPEAIRFRFCTECLIEGEMLDVAALRADVEGLGDSVVVAGSPRRVRVHVHTDHPQRVFEAVGARGRVVHTKADDMRTQHIDRFERARVAVVTDTAADIPQRDLQRLRIHTVPLRVFLGREVYLDKQTLNPDEVYEWLIRGEQDVRTSQPPPGDYAALYRYLFEHYGSIVVVSLSGALSGTIDAARKGAQLADPGRVEIFDTGTASIAQGLVVRAAAERALAGGEPGDVIRAAADARSRVRLFLGAPTLEYFERGGRVGSWKTRLAGWLRLVPLLTLSPEHGRPRVLGVARRGHVQRRLLDRACAAVMSEPSPPERIWIAHAAAAEVADACRARLAEAAPGSRIEIVEVGPVLGAHAGPGSVAVAFLGAGHESRKEREGGEDG